MSDDFVFGEDEKEESSPNYGELVEESKFKGRPVISFRRHPQDEHPFTFGIAKAKMILENIQAIEAFVEKHDR